MRDIFTLVEKVNSRNSRSWSNDVLCKTHWASYKSRGQVDWLRNLFKLFFCQFKKICWSSKNPQFHQLIKSLFSGIELLFF